MMPLKEVVPVMWNSIVLLKVEHTLKRYLQNTVQGRVAENRLQLIYTIYYKYCCIHTKHFIVREVGQVTQ